MTNSGFTYVLTQERNHFTVRLVARTSLIKENCLAIHVYIQERSHFTVRLVERISHREETCYGIYAHILEKNPLTVRSVKRILQTDVICKSICNGRMKCLIVKYMYATDFPATDGSVPFFFFNPDKFTSKHFNLTQLPDLLTRGHYF